MRRFIRILLFFLVLGVSFSLSETTWAQKNSVPVQQGKKTDIKATDQAAKETSEETAEADDDFADFDDEFGEEAIKKNEVWDPLEGYNRWMYDFNYGFYKYLLRPSVIGYNWVVPEPVRVSIDNFFDNLSFPIRFINNLLQLKFIGAGKELGRFLFNSTFGLAGLFDPANAWLGVPHKIEDFGQTLGYYGVGIGFPVVIPFIGQSTLRDGIGLVPVTYAHPVTYLLNANYNTLAAIYENFNFTSLHYLEADALIKDAIDPYILIRDSFLQNRKKLIEE